MPRQVLSFILAFTLVTLASAAPADDFDRLRERLVVMFTGGDAYRADDPVLGPRLNELVTRVVSNGKSPSPSGKGYWDTMEKGAQRTNRVWRDTGRLTVNYTKVGDTVTRLGEMARVYAMPHSPLYKNPQLARDILDAIDFSLAQNYNETIEHKNYDNWFALELGIPLRLLPTLMMLGDAVPRDRLAYYLKVVDKFAPYPDKVGGHHQPATGANLAWKCRVVAMSAILAKDAKRLALISPSLDPLWATVDKDDGFYADGSFIQHRYFAYTGGYGVSAVGEPLLLVALLQGTPWALDPARVRLNIDRLERSFAPLVVRGEMMDMVRGREISRAATSSLTTGAGVARLYLRALDLVPTSERPALRARVKSWLVAGSFFGPLPDRPGTLSEEVAARALLLDDTVAPAAPPRAHHVFAAMDRVVHRAGDWSAGLSLYSSRIAPFEAINGENRRGWHTSSGQLALYLGDNRQFAEGYWPTIDSHRLAGVTAVSGAEPKGERSKSPVAGGAVSADGLFGVSVFELRPADNENLKARKAWFFLDDAVVCLGSGLASGPAQRLETTVENRRLADAGDQAFTCSPGNAPLPLVPAPAAPRDLKAVRLAHLAGNEPGADLGFVFPVPADLKVVRESRTGAWSDISKTSLEAVSPEPLTRHYLTLWFDHGVAPADASYAYILLPRATREQTAAYAEKPRAVVVANTQSVQAVSAPALGFLGAVFWKDSPTPVGSGDLTFKATDRCVATVRRVDGRLLVSAADPSQTLTGKLVIEVGASASRLVSADPEVTVLQTSPVVRLSINVAGLRGRTVKAELK